MNTIITRNQLLNLHLCHSSSHASLMHSQNLPAELYHESSDILQDPYAAIKINFPPSNLVKFTSEKLATISKSMSFCDSQNYAFEIWICKQVNK